LSLVVPEKWSLFGHKMSCRSTRCQSRQERIYPQSSSPHIWPAACAVDHDRPHHIVLFAWPVKGSWKAKSPREIQRPSIHAFVRVGVTARGATCVCG
jgi:hypothetical protein